MSSFLDFEHVSVVRGKRTVLHNVSLKIERGEQVAILGPNGCGKSTLLKTMTCELYPLALPETHVSILGRERWDLTELKRRLGVVQAELPGKPILQANGFDAVLTGFFSSSTLWPNLVITPEMRDRAATMLKRINAEPLAAKPFGAMSAGQQRRILIGRALVASSECLLLDEPSNALDLRAQRELRELLMELAEQGTTLVHITHHTADIIPAMRRVLFMSAGRIVEDGAPEALLTADKLGALFGTEVRVAWHEGFLHTW